MNGMNALVVLSGCGNMDGSEIHEAVCALLALEQSGFDTRFAAPDIQQARSLSHVTGEAMATRRVLEESARIARGRICGLSAVNRSEYDMVVFPGGMGAAVSLCGYAGGESSADFGVDPEIRELIERAHGDGKPIGAMCIAPIILAACLRGVTVTFGTECDAAVHARRIGAQTVDCPAVDAVVDPVFRVVTTPAYMVAKSIAEVYLGAARMVEELESFL